MGWLNFDDPLGYKKRRGQQRTLRMEGGEALRHMNQAKMGFLVIGLLICDA
jgi:hypothetical protein